MWCAFLTLDSVVWFDFLSTFIHIPGESEPLMKLMKYPIGYVFIFSYHGYQFSVCHPKKKNDTEKASLPVMCLYHWRGGCFMSVSARRYVRVYGVWGNTHFQCIQIYIFSIWWFVLCSLYLCIHFRWLQFIFMWFLIYFMSFHFLDSFLCSPTCYYFTLCVNSMSLSICLRTKPYLCGIPKARVGFAINPNEKKRRCHMNK